MVGFEAVGFTAQNELSARRAIGGRATERPLEVSPREPPRCSQPRLRFSAIYMVRDIACFAAPTCGRWRGQLRGQTRTSADVCDMIAVGTRVTSRPPPRSVRAQFGHTACMGLSLSSVHHTIFSCFVAPFFCSTRAASILPPRPQISATVARSGGQGRRFFSAAEGLSLTDASTAAGYPRSGGRPRNDPRGACHWPRAIARTTLVFG